MVIMRVYVDRNAIQVTKSEQKVSHAKTNKDVHENRLNTNTYLETPCFGNLSSKP